MSTNAKPHETITQFDLQEWLVTLGLPVDQEDPLSDQLSDGIVLCQLMNRIKPGSVDNIKPRRSVAEAEENISRFLQACTAFGVKKSFKPAEFVDNFAAVLVTLQELYRMASDDGIGLKVTRQLSKKRLQETKRQSTPEDEDTDESETNGAPRTFKALYPFNGTNDDELQFEKGDIIIVTKIVDGGWWEGTCNGRSGWFPGNYAEEVNDGEAGQVNGDGGQAGNRESALYYNLVVQDILDTERSYVHDLNTLLSVYLVPLKSTSVLVAKDVDCLIGNLPELCKWQQSFFGSLEDCARQPVAQQKIASVFLKAYHEMESLYSTYCANHPKAVAVLTENSDKLSLFMESKGASSPGILTLTSSLSQPFRRLEKYPALLKELQRHLSEGHPEAENVEQCVKTYNSISAHTQEIRKRKEMEHEMLTNPVKGYSGQCLMELGECSRVIQVHQALSAEEVDERFFLIFPSTFVILGVGQILSGYELKANYPLLSVSAKKGEHSESWPYPVEVHHKSEVIHVSLASEKDQSALVDAIGVGSVGKSFRTTSSSSVRSLSQSRTSSTSLFRPAYPPRAMRKTAQPIARPHHWGFKSLRPTPPIKSQQLIALREKDNVKSPKSAKKFIYPVVKKRRSKAMEEVLSAIKHNSATQDTRAGDTAILKVIEAYCASGRSRSLTLSYILTGDGVEGERETNARLSALENQVQQLCMESAHLRECLVKEVKARKVLEDLLSKSGKEHLQSSSPDLQ